MNYLSVTIHQVNHYYPFGMPMDCPTTNAYQRWLFGDKEFDRTHGLDLYDQAARQYDPITGRFRSVDPLAEKYHPLSPYLFCVANPAVCSDPTGKDITILIAPEGASNYGHMAAILQDKDKRYYYVTAGATADPGLAGIVSNSNTPGGILIQRLSATSVEKAIIEVNKTDGSNSEYKDSVTFETSSKMDDQMLRVASEKSEAMSTGDEKYRVLSNNCADIIEEIFEKGTKVDLPTGLSPSPNTNFQNIKEKHADIQKNLDKKRNEKEGNQ